MAFGESPQAIIKSGLEEALDTMSEMTANPGQDTVYNDYVIEAFRENAQADVEEGWTDVDIGEYMDFMGEIVAEGNSIMQDAYDYAQEVQAEYDAIIDIVF
jgi:hypothetical protein